MKKATLLLVIIIILCFGTSLWFFPKMPDIMASHWDINGKVKGYMPKIFGVFLLPFVLVTMVLLFIVIPKIDPAKIKY